MLSPNYKDEVRLFLKEYGLYEYENSCYNGILFTSDMYIIHCSYSYITIRDRYFAQECKTNNLKHFKKTILGYEYNRPFKSWLSKVNNLFDEVYKLINIYNTYSNIPYKFIDITEYWLYNHKSEYDPLVEIPHLKKKIKPGEGKEYFYYKQLYETITDTK